MKSFFFRRPVMMTYVLALWVSGPFVTAATSQPASGLPGLNATRSDSSLALSWPLPANHFVLESATDFAATDWQNVPEMLTIADGYCEVIVPLDRGDVTSACAMVAGLHNCAALRHPHRGAGILPRA